MLTITPENGHQYEHFLIHIKTGAVLSSYFDIKYRFLLYESRLNPHRTWLKPSIIMQYQKQSLLPSFMFCLEFSDIRIVIKLTETNHVIIKTVAVRFSGLYKCETVMHGL